MSSGPANGASLVDYAARKLGLRLASIKANIDVLVVDKANKMPTGN